MLGKSPLSLPKVSGIRQYLHEYSDQFFGILVVPFSTVERRAVID